VSSPRALLLRTQFSLRNTLQRFPPKRWRSDLCFFQLRQASVKSFLRAKHINHHPVIRRAHQSTSQEASVTHGLRAGNELNRN
jgi:hypothetical protein